jgi:hypothetical protein
LLGKTNEERFRQRLFFVNLSEAGLQFVRMQMTQFSRPPGDGDDQDGDEGPGLETDDVPANLRARVMHLADDSASSGFLEIIYGGVTKKARREMMDDKSTRNTNLWKTLADDYFNNPDWKPENEQTDTRAETINPRKAPAPFPPEKLRALFSAQRTQYSLFNQR